MYDGNSIGGIGNSYESNSAAPVSYNSASPDQSYDGGLSPVSYSSNALMENAEESSDSTSQFDQILEDETPKYQSQKQSQDIAMTQSATMQSGNPDQNMMNQNFFLNKELQNRESKTKDSDVKVESIEEMISSAIENAVSK